MNNWDNMIKKCLQCGGEVTPVKNNYAIFCSKQCSTKHWKELNKETIRIKRAAYYLKNKSKERLLNKKWYEKNKESELAKNKEYRAQNKELFNWYHNKRRFNGIREMVLERDNSKCRHCGSQEKVNVHHKDGTGVKRKKTDIATNNDINNLITLCGPCHTSLHHWQKRNHIILSKDEDIVRTLKKLREASSKS